MVAFQLIDGTRWLVVFPPLALLLILWLGQAIHAYRGAIALGAKPGGELQVAFYLPVAVAVLTAFWLVGGKHGSPSATLEAYVVSWVSGRTDAAAALFAEPPEPAQLGAQWTSEITYLGDRVTQLAATYGPSSGLDPERPFDNLRFRDPVADVDGQELVVMDIVRRQQFQNMVLGIIPTASQQTVLVEQAGTIRLRLVEQPATTSLSIGQLHSYSWTIDAVEIGGR